MLETIIITFLVVIALAAILMVIFGLIGNVHYFTKPYMEILESKQERMSLLELTGFLGGLLLLCEYI